jgi:L-histidine N-alpha-methyltransferase
MKSIANVAIHASQFPEQVRCDLLTSLRTRRVNHKFHYDSVKQTQKWLALHEAHSPARYDQDCLATYDRAFIAATAQIKPKRVLVIGLGCGGGQKDVRLLKLLKAGGKTISYAPCDVGVAMTLVARKVALKIVPETNCFPFVCDLATAHDLPAIFDSRFTVRDSRLVTFFGMIPNFEPQIILPKLASLIRPKDYLLFSANLAPGDNYAAGMKKVLPQYDNAATCEWLVTFLLDLGIDLGDGKLHFVIEAGGLGLKRIVAKFKFNRLCQVAIEAAKFTFQRDELIRLFFSYRYTPALVRKNLAQRGLEVCHQWVTQSEEEGVFLVRRCF